MLMAFNTPKKKKKSFQYAHTLGLNYDKVGSMMLSSLELKFLIMNLIMKLACKWPIRC